ncbi:MAG: DNA-3-methyladenine glycosylase 2 family protein [bacterium]|nr:DNA-3-methyladenine glycosylase 2 family protein [bacterium]
MGRLIARVGPCGLRYAPGRSPYEALGEAIVYQQLSGKAAATIFSRLCALYPLASFPEPPALLATPDEALRGAGISASKARALKDLAAKTDAGHVPSYRTMARMSDAAIVERLVAIRGIGRWTVEMLLIFNLGRPDVLPVHDYGVRKGFAALHKRGELPTPRELGEYGERWRPFRSVASWYLWRAAESVTQGA